jgi:sortase B
MFKRLLDYKDESFYKNHKTIYLDSIYHTGVYEVFAAFDITLGDIDPSVSSFASNEEFIDYVYGAKDLTAYSTSAVINESDTIVTLVTCDRYFKKKIGRFVVMAVKVSD